MKSKQGAYFCDYCGWSLSIQVLDHKPESLSCTNEECPRYGEHYYLPTKELAIITNPVLISQLQDLVEERPRFLKDETS